MIKINGKELGHKFYLNNESIVDTDFDLSARHMTVEFQYIDDTDLLRLYYTLAHIRTYNPEVELDLVIQYMPYSRMDRSQNGSCFTLSHTVALLSYVLPIRCRVRILEPHSDVTLSLFKELDIDAEAVFITPELAQKVSVTCANESNNIEVLCYPDKGALTRYSVMMGEHGLDTVHCNKVRDFDTGNIIGLDMSAEDKECVVGKNVLIIDDLCCKGGTFWHTGNLLKDSGAKSVSLCVAHLEPSVLQGQLLQEDSPIDKIYSTTTMVSDPEIFLGQSKLVVCPVSWLDTYKALVTPMPVECM